MDADAPDDKITVLDILCIANDETRFNIEVQVQNLHDMERRTLYYWSQLYRDSIKRSADYSALHRTVTINLLAYSFLPQKAFHNMYGLYDIRSKHRLTEDIKIHFLELPKVTPEMKNLRGMRLLEKWVTYLNNKLSHEEMEELAMSEPAIKEAWAATDRFMRDKALRLAYLSEEIKEHDYVSTMNWERRAGRAEGRAEGELRAHKKTALRMLRAKMPPAEIAAFLDLPEETILQFAKDSSTEN